MNRWLFRFILVAFLTLAWGFLFLSTPSTAQELPVPTAVPNAERALGIYESRCASCHGLEGNGDGELAPQSLNPPTVFANPEYRQTAVPAELFNTITNGRLSRGMPLFGGGSSNPLTDEQMWDLVALIYSFSTPPESIERGRELANNAPPPENLSFWYTSSNESAQAFFIDNGVLSEELSVDDQLVLVDYLRTGSYGFVDLALLNAPIETAIITGSLLNGTTETAVGNLEINLRAFTLDFVEAINQTTTATTDGSYRFELEQVAPDWIYIVSTEYNGYSFNSSPNQIERANPTVELPITVFDTGTNEQAIVVEQLQLIVDFVENSVQIAELYTLSNLSPTLFIGSEGNPELGTLRFALPAGATDVLFQRAFGSTGNFTAAPEIVQGGVGWVDIVPLNPGRGVAEILVTYSLPFEANMTIAHPLSYPVNQAILLMPNNGVEVGGNGWQFQGQQTVPIGQVNSYSNTALQSAEVLNLTLNGRPRTVRDETGNTVLQRNNQREIIVGSLSLLAAASLLFTVYSYQAQPDKRSHTPEGILQQIANLDTAYEKESLTRSQYVQQRQALKADLIELWQKEG